MVVLNFYGSIKSAICISDKLKLYISNFNSDNTPEWISGWKGELEEELLLAMAINVLNNKRYNIQKGDPLIILYNNIFPNNPTTTSLTKNKLKISRIRWYVSILVMNTQICQWVTGLLIVLTDGFVKKTMPKKSFHFLTFSPVPLIDYKTFLIPLQIGYIHQIMIK